MKKLSTILFLVLTFIFASLSFAQQSKERLWMATEIVVKSDQIANFEKLLNEIANLCKVQDYEHSWITFQSTGLKYYYFMEIESLGQFDELQQSSEEFWSKNDPSILKNYMECVDSFNRFTLHTMNEYSYFPENPRMSMDEMNYALWDVHYPKTEHLDAYLENMKEFIDKVKAYGYGDPILVLEGGIGVDSPMYMGVLYGKNEIDFLQENQKMWDSFGEEGKEMYLTFIKLLRNRKK